MNDHFGSKFVELFQRREEAWGGAPINGDEIYIKSELIQSEAAFLTRVRVGLPL